ncbi:MAG TPA: PAS domain S-box protein, partial [Negativicutes bacterium]
MKDKEPNAITKEIDEWLLEFLFHGNCTILPALQESKSGQQVVQLFNKLQEFIQILGKNGQVQFNDIEDLILIFNRLQSFLESWKGQISWNETKKTERNSKGINVGYSLFDVLVLALEKSRKLLQEHEQRYRLIKENSIDVIWMMDVDSYKLTYASPSISNLRGITVKEAMNESLQEAVLPESYKVVYEYLQSLKELQPGEVVSPICKTLLIQQRHKNGHALAIEMNIIALPDANGFIRRITGVSRGSKSRSVVEEEKPKNDENIQRILDTIPVALVFVRVADNTIIYVNQKCCEVFGCTREDSIGRNSIHYWVNVTEWGEYVRQFRLQGFMKDYEAKMKRHGGERFWALISSAIVEYNGERVNISGIMDIQERKNLEIMAAKSEARFRTIVETVPFPFPIIITRKVDDVIMYVNTIAVEIFGFSNEETIGKSAVSIYVNPEERLFIGQEIKRYGCVNNREVMIKNSKEKVYYALISGATISVSGEEVILFGMQDITAMKIMEQELRKLATTDFLTNVANHRKWLELAEQE